VEERGISMNDWVYQIVTECKLCDDLRITSFRLRSGKCALTVIGEVVGISVAIKHLQNADAQKGEKA
jgi:hypothetical protein